MKTCDGGCGDYCCTQLVRTVTGQEKARLERVAAERGLTLDIGDKDWFLYTWKDTPCPFYDGTCTVYEDRPFVCKSWMCRDCATEDEHRAHSKFCLAEERLHDDGWAWFSP